MNLTDHRTEEVTASLTEIAHAAQRLQRQLLRADGLGNLEREMMLSTILTLLAAVNAMEEKL